MTVHSDGEEFAAVGDIRLARYDDARVGAHLVGSLSGETIGDNSANLDASFGVVSDTDAIAASLDITVNEDRWIGIDETYSCKELSGKMADILESVLRGVLGKTGVPSLLGNIDKRLLVKVPAYAGFSFRWMDRQLEISKQVHVIESWFDDLFHNRLQGDGFASLYVSNALFTVDVDAYGGSFEGVQYATVHANEVKVGATELKPFTVSVSKQWWENVTVTAFNRFDKKMWSLEYLAEIAADRINVNNVVLYWFGRTASASFTADVVATKRSERAVFEAYISDASLQLGFNEVARDYSGTLQYLHSESALEFTFVLFDPNGGTRVVMHAEASKNSEDTRRWYGLRNVGMEFPGFAFPFVDWISVEGDLEETTPVGVDLQLWGPISAFHIKLNEFRFTESNVDIDGSFGLTVPNSVTQSADIDLHADFSSGDVAISGSAHSYSLPDATWPSAARRRLTWDSCTLYQLAPRFPWDAAVFSCSFEACEGEVIVASLCPKGEQCVCDPSVQLSLHDEGRMLKASSATSISALSWHGR